MIYAIIIPKSTEKRSHSSGLFFLWRALETSHCDIVGGAMNGEHATSSLWILIGQGLPYWIMIIPNGSQWWDFLPQRIINHQGTRKRQQYPGPLVERQIKQNIMSVNCHRAHWPNRSSTLQGAIQKLVNTYLVRYLGKLSCRKTTGLISIFDVWNHLEPTNHTVDRIMLCSLPTPNKITC